MFGYLIPRNYMEALQFDSENKNSKWYDAIKLEMEPMLEYKRLYAHQKSRIRLLGKSSFLFNKSAYTKMMYIYEKPFFRSTFLYIT